MVDILTPAARSERMSRVRSKNTKPEITVRRALHGAGLRYRLHPEDVFGTPDLFFVKQRAAVFVHGCFWHRHGCYLSKDPDDQSNFWIPKLQKNQARDEFVKQELLTQGIRHLAVWECSIRGRGRLQPAELAQRVRDWLMSGAPSGDIHRQEHVVNMWNVRVGRG